MAFTERIDLSDAQVKAISALVNGRISQNESVLDAHGRDESAFPPIRPSAVVTVHSTEEVSKVLAYCNQEKIPVVAFGVGSSLEGHVLPLFGGISLDISEMDQILAIYIDQDGGRPAALAAGFDADLVDKVVRLVDRAEYKRRQYPPGTKISSRAFGKDRRLPITSHWNES